MSGNLHRTHLREKGFTLIELLVAMAITGVIGSGLGMVMYNIFNVSASNGARMIAVTQIQHAVDAISRDAAMVQNYNGGPGFGSSTGFPLTLYWVDWDNTINMVEYDITADNRLTRTLWINTTDKTQPAQPTTTLASNIDDVYNPSSPETAPTRVWRDTAHYSLNFKITCQVTGLKTATESRTFQIMCVPTQTGG